MIVRESVALASENGSAAAGTSLGPAPRARLRPLRLLDLDEKMPADAGEGRTGDHDDLVSHRQRGQQ